MNRFEYLAVASDGPYLIEFAPDWKELVSPPDFSLLPSCGAVMRDYISVVRNGPIHREGQEEP
ncbi:hypothetical protein NITGR_750042 [Nitrospina gracilis 3/211]|uniref:Uncharacterized protein n=1 Tax=Nitrospina gracilis (strain 3/211) TaxID=1266370 RepID=M1YMM0_NITG3|nr:hypothetical protein NITGR_750042 [Nitrospina gracilis 3/211]